ncbi:hypothetical protein SKAU_G00060230 [Synaphobranchus kaupii]|uniref:Gypsy retrotransposon integrase-like protein 1 n=1 Tax=Synaphobranchus kaupii TaxID=118154 RepID=A0A9Q1G4M8_SYNKA|nr:hypothetical protein SKAU_G00060230 [Synaphobranchus kaupii]
MAGIFGHIVAFDESTEQWSTYVERFEHFVLANGITEEKKLSVFLSVIGSTTYGLLRSLIAPEKPGGKSYDQTVEVLRAHFSPKPIVIAERFRFHKRHQAEGETIAQYIADLKKLSEHCEFGAYLQDALRDRFVCGLISESIQKRLLTETALTYHKAVEMAISMDTVAREAHQLSSSLKVNAMSLSSSPGRNCTRCGRTNHLESDCFYKDQTCHRCAPSIFQRVMDQVLQGLPNVHCFLDDILVTGCDDAEHRKNLEAVLSRLEKFGLRVQREKCEFFKGSLEYLGHVIDATGLHKSPEKLRAIAEAPAPTNVGQLRSFLGLINYYGRFVPNMATMLSPLHALLHKGTHWKWSPECEKAFCSAKDLLLSERVLTHYNPQLPIRLACDASPYGVGAVISHVMPGGQARPIAFASRTLSKAEQNYAQIEREALGIIFGMRKFHAYLYGRHFTLLTDHRPLTTIFSPSKAIPSMAAVRLQRWALILTAHNYTIQYRSAAEHGNADGLSRLPLQVDHKDRPGSVDTVLIHHLDSLPECSTDIRKETRYDPVLAQVLDMILSGHFLVAQGRDSALTPYYSRRDELTVVQGCLLWGNRVIVPPKLRPQLLQELHAGHPGVVKMKAMARSYIWWPGIDAQIEQLARMCQSCQRNQKSPSLSPLHS